MSMYSAWQNKLKIIIWVLALAHTQTLLESSYICLREQKGELMFVSSLDLYRLNMPYHRLRMSQTICSEVIGFTSYIHLATPIIHKLSPLVPIHAIHFHKPQLKRQLNKRRFNWSLFCMHLTLPYTLHIRYVHSAAQKPLTHKLGKFKRLRNLSNRSNTLFSPLFSICSSPVHFLHYLIRNVSGNPKLLSFMCSYQASGNSIPK